MDTSFRLFPKQASTLAPQVDALYLFMLAVTLFFTVLIFCLVFYFAIKYRRRSEEPPAETVTDSRLEMAWTVIPLLISMVMFVWGAKVYIAESQIPENAMEVNIIGKQWMWKAQHPDGRREINELTVPVGRPVKLVMTSQDVIHSFYVPAFRIKQDVLPGRYSYMWFEATDVGEYHLFCAEYCGAQHSGMIGKVVVKSPADYARWLSAVPPGENTAAAAGEKLFAQYSCIVCHSARGPSMAGLYGRKGRPVLVENGAEMTPDKVDVDEQYLRESILYPRAKIAVDPEGRPYPPELMPSYDRQLTEEQLLDLIAYVKSLAAGAPQGLGAGQMDPGTRMQELAPPPPDLSHSTAQPKAR